MIWEGPEISDETSIERAVMGTFVVSLFFANAIARTDTTPHEQTASLDAACQAKHCRVIGLQNVVNPGGCVAPTNGAAVAMLRALVRGDPAVSPRARG
jgi:hypothetical protein